MATTTTNLKLTKPAVSEAADISVLNDNFDKIDALGGYGLGWAQSLSAYNGGDLDTLTAPGWYFWDSKSTSTSIAGVTERYWYIHVIAYGDGHLHCKQEIYPTTRNFYSPAIRKCSSGTWGEWEWENPPMSLGVEYRTTERYLGKAVYAKAINFGALPNNSSKNVAHASAVDQTIIALDGVLSDGCHITSGLNRDRAVASDGTITVDNTKWNIRVITNYDFSGVTATFIVKYIKE